MSAVSLMIFALLSACFRLIRSDLSNYHLLQVLPANESHIEKLLELDELSEKVNLLHDPSLRGPNYLYLDPTSFGSVTTTLNEYQIPFSIKSRDLQSLVDREMAEVHLRKLRYSSKSSYDLENYHTYSGIQQILATMAKEHPDYVSLSSIGQSYESRDIPVVVLSKSPNSTNKIVVLECGMHAREWVSPATCLWIMDDILSNNTQLLDEFDFHVFPMMNPDGYVATWSFNRFWRKNRRPTSLFWCVGVDLNRNFDAGYERAPSSLPCSEVYHGTSAFSEPETAALREHLMKVNDRLLFYYSLHAFSQMWMYPYAYKSDPPQNVGLIDYLSDVASEAMKDIGAAKYTFGQIYHIIYPAYGSSADWAFETTNAKLAFAIELRDTGDYGFLLPPDQIAPTAREIWYALRQVFFRYSRLKPAEIESLIRKGQNKT